MDFRENMYEDENLTWHALFFALVSAVLGISWFGLENLFSRRSHEPHPSENLPPLFVIRRARIQIRIFERL